MGEGEEGPNGEGEEGERGTVGWRMREGWNERKMRGEAVEGGQWGM